MDEMADTLDRVKDGELSADGLVEVARRLGPSAVEPLLGALFTGGQPHEGACGNPVWEARQAELLRAIGATGSERAVPWLAFVVHVASDIEEEGAAAEALDDIGTEHALEELAQASLESGAMGEDAEDLYDVLQRHSRPVFDVLAVAVEDVLRGWRDGDRVRVLLECCAEGQEPGRTEAARLLARLDEG